MVAPPAPHSLMVWLLLMGAVHAQGQFQSLDKFRHARDVVTEEELRSQVAASKTLADQLGSFAKPVEAQRPSSGNALYEKSIILFDGEMHTLIPVGSVLHLPPALRARVVAKPSGDFTFWPNFLKRNKAWLAGREVPLEMAKGSAKFTGPILLAVAQDPRLLVSVYKGCPITVLEPVAEEATDKP